MHWLLLGGAIVFEVIGTISLKLSDGFTRYVFVAVTVTGYVVSFSMMGLALKGLPVSVVYSIWAGTGTALVALIGMIFMNESVSVMKIACIGLIVAGVVGLHMADKTV